MPYTQAGLGFNGRSPLSRHCSYQAAQAQEPSRATKTARYLAWLRAVGSAQDWTAADALGWPLSTAWAVTE